MTGYSRQSKEFFESRYEASSDPWQFASSAYELARYQTTLESLSRGRYRRAFEPGCSVGVLTAQLAPRVRHLIACDLSDAAVARAKERCRDSPHVEIYQGDVAAGPPRGTFDLMVFSELGYYFSVDQLRALVNRLADGLESGGEFLAVHWLGHSADHLLHGDAVHEVLGEALPCDWLGGSRHAGFRIDAWRRVP
jgi:trans-aconitate methyltransferase